METDTHRLKETHMKHCIIAKFNDSVSDKAAMTSQIEELFSSAPSMDGVHGCTVLKNCIVPFVVCVLAGLLCMLNSSMLGFLTA